jgi:DNA-binding NtrC family response regulator
MPAEGAPLTPLSHPIVLIIDDDPDQVALLTAHVERARRFVTKGFASAAEALDAIAVEPPDAVVCDLVMPEIDGIEFTRRLRATHPALPIIIATASGSEADARRAFATGASDFVSKPVDAAALVARIQRCLDEAPARALLSNTVRRQFDPHGIVGAHPRIRDVRRFIEQVADVPSVSALLLGESGTGKNLVARAIHAAGEQANYRFVEVNCAALPASLLEAELFGYEKGAFTDARQTKKGLVEEADGGTLFLDEVGTMPLEVQAKLLTFLESRSFRRVGSTRELQANLRVIAATNADLAAEARRNAFREDLFYRLNVASTVLPPLRAIRSDIPELARHFVRRAAEYFRRPVPVLDPSSVEALQRHDWPGNARELRNVIERALIFSREPVLVVDDPRPHSGGNARGDATAGMISLPRGLTLEQVERLYIEATLDEMNGNVQAAAERLGITRKVLWSRRRKLGILDHEH